MIYVVGKIKQEKEKRRSNNTLFSYLVKSLRPEGKEEERGLEGSSLSQFPPYFF